jgi:hypothetical protein
MRLTIWFVLLFGVAVVAASTLGTNDGLASFYWGSWRLDVSLNLFLLVLVATCFLIVAVIQAVSSVVGLPKRAREWRTARRDRTGQAALRDALAQYFGGRYTRAQKSAERALAIQAETPELVQDNEFTVLGHLLAARIGCRTAPPATRSCGWRWRSRRTARRRARPKKARACSPRSGRSTIATPRERRNCSASCRSAWRGEPMRCA